MATVDLYDGNNILIRALTSFNPHTRSALDLRLRYNGAKASDIWCWDGKDHNSRRRDIYPAYKMNREPLGENIYSYIRLWRELLKLSPASQIDVPTWEADDVIATVARKLAARGTKVVIHSNDADYCQLTANPMITVDGVRNPPTAGRWIALFKACVGDKSDNITGIPGFGKGTWEQVSDELEWLEQAIVQGSPHAFEALTLPRRVKNWLFEPTNGKLLQEMLLVTHFLTVPDAELNTGTTKGLPNPAKAEDLLNRYFL